MANTIPKMPLAGGPETGAGVPSPASFMSKIQAFDVGNFLKGKPGQWKKTLIIGVIVLFFIFFGNTMAWGMALWALGNSYGDPSGNFGSDSCPQAFDLSTHTIYEDKTATGDFDAHWARTDEAKQYAITTLGIPESSMENPSKSEVENMIRAEVVSQFNSLSNRHGSTVVDAQIAALSYQEHESAAFKLFDSEGKPSYTISGQYAVTNIMSLSNDKFCTNGRDRDDECASYWKNKRAAASYDIKYAIYLGIKEIMGAFSSSVNGNGQQRWKNAIGYVFLPSNPGCYWNGGESYCRHTVARSAWDSYESKEVPYVCNTGSGAYGDPANGLGYNNVPLYKQCEGDWATMPFGYRNRERTQRATVCSGGCGPTSAAMVLKFYGKNVDPGIIATYTLQNGFREDGIGTEHALFSKLADDYGLNYERVNFDRAETILRNRQPLILSVGNLYYNGNGHWPFGHFIVLTGMEGNKVFVNDSSSANVTSTTMSNLRNSFRGGIHYIHP